MKGIGLKDELQVKDRTFQITTGNDPSKNKVASEVFEKGHFLFSLEENYHVRHTSSGEVDGDYLKKIAQEQHQTAISDIRSLFVINEKIKQLRQYLPHYRLGRVFYHRNFIPEAIDNFRRSTEINKDFIRGYQRLGLAYIKNGQYKAAVNTLMTAHKMKPAYPDIANAIAVAYTQMEDYSAASTYLKKAIDLKNDFDEANFNWGVVLFLSALDERGGAVPARLHRAFKNLRSSKRFAGDHWQEKFDATEEALKSEDIGKRIKALLDIQREVLVNDDNTDIMDFFFLQFMYGGKEIKGQEVQQFEEMIMHEVESHKEYADYWNELGVIHLIQCREFFLKAIAEFEKSSKIDPNFESARRNTDMLQGNKQGFLILLRAILR